MSSSARSTCTASCEPHCPSQKPFMKCVLTGVERRETPEELVRQAVARDLIHRYGYRREDMRFELPIQMGSSSGKRADIAIFRPETDRSQLTQHNAYIIVECKRADVYRSGFEAAKEQLKSYMAACNNSHFGMVIAGDRRVCFRELKNADGHFENVEVDDIPYASAPRAHFTVVGSSPVGLPQQLARYSSPRQVSYSPSTKPADGSPLRALGVILAVSAGTIGAAVLVWRSWTGPVTPSYTSPVIPLPSAAAHPGEPASQIPHTRTAPPKIAEWSAVKELRLEPLGCYRKVLREWLKLNCASRASPRAIHDIHDMGVEGNGYFKWESAGVTVDLVVRMVPGHTAAAVFDVAGTSFVGGYDWMVAEQPPVITWSPR